MHLKVLISLLFTLCLIACQNSSTTKSEEEQNQPATKPNPNWNYQETTKFKFAYPNSWELIDDGSQGTAFIVVSPRIDSSDNFSESVNLVTQNVGDADLDDYVELSEAQIEEFMTDSEILSRRREMINDIPFHYCTFKATDQGTRFVFEQRYAIKEGVAYILTYTAEVDQYESMKPLADVVINSFALK